MRIFMERNNPMTALLSNWVDACCLLMAPLNDALYRYVMNTRTGTIHGTSVGELLAWIKEDENPRKGEMVLIIEGHKARDDELPRRCAAYAGAVVG